VKIGSALRLSLVAVLQLCSNVENDEARKWVSSAEAV
jgi:hypothetical protein